MNKSGAGCQLNRVGIRNQSWCEIFLRQSARKLQEMD